MSPRNNFKHFKINKLVKKYLYFKLREFFDIYKRHNF